MKSFRDTVGREWAITVDVGAIKRVMKAPIEHLGDPIKVNLLELVDPDGELLKKVVGYPPLVCDIAYALCKPQCDEKNISDEDFGRAMGGDVLEKVLDAIIEETVDFFPQGRRTVLKKVLEKSQAFAEKAKTLTAARLATGELDAAIDALLEPELRKLEAAADQWYWLCYELAGIVGVDPEPRTLAELMAMAKGRQKAEWERTAQLSALILSPHRDVNKHPEPFEPWEFNPFADRQLPRVKRPEIKMSVNCLKALCKPGTEQ